MSTTRSPVSVIVLTAITGLVVNGLLSVYNNKVKTRTLPALDQADTQRILKSIVRELATPAEACIALATTVKEDLMKMIGPMPSDAEMMTTYVYPAFKTEYYKIQDKVLSEYNVCESELEEAIEHYGPTERIIDELAKEIQSLFIKFGGAAPEEGGEGQGGAGGGKTIVDVVNELASRVLTATNEFCAQYVQSMGIPESPEEQQNCAMQLSAVGDRVQGEYIKELGIRPEDFQDLLQKSAAVPEVQQAFLQIQQGVPAILQHHGISLGM